MKISIFNDQCGCGKSYNLREKLSTFEGNFIVVSKEHKLLDEYEELPNCVHLKGFSTLCSKFNEDLVQIMFKKELPRSLICNTMGCKGKCMYKDQFKDLENKNILMTLAMLNTGIIDTNEYDFIAFDEGIDGKELLEYDKEEILRQFEVVEWDSLTEALENKDLDFLQSHEKEIKTKIYKVNSELASKCKWNKIVLIDVSKLITFLLIEQIYGEKEYYFIPDMFSVFKLDTDVTMLSATFTEDKLKRMINRYQMELNPMFECSYEITNSGFVTSPSIITRVGKAVYHRAKINGNSNDPKVKETVKFLKGELKTLAKKHGKKNICISTFKNEIKDGKYLGYPAFGFGTNKGTNEYLHYKVQVNIGTYTYPAEVYKDLFRLYYPDKEVPEIKDYSLNNKYGVYLPKNPVYQVIWYKHAGLDMYDNFHRTRPLQNLRYIYSYGWVPTGNKEEMTYVQVESL